VIESPTKVHERWLLEAQAHHAEGGCFVLTNHPFISGRPSKATALERLIEDVKALAGMWVTTLGEIATHAEGAVEEVRRIPRVRCPEGYFDRKDESTAAGGTP
jgi:peptidoglycan/xylan/chitin deacetylase (PgdA/CDA1 family)